MTVTPPRGLVLTTSSQGEKVLASTRRAQELGAVAAEWRVDAWANPEAALTLIPRSPLPVLFTCRPVSEGGLFKGDEAGRLALLEKALQAGAAWVDWDFPLGPPPALLPSERRVVSLHLSAPLGANPVDAHGEFFATPAAVHKLVSTAHHAGHLPALRDLLAGAKDRTVACFAMGSGGLASRVLGLAWGSCWVFAPLKDEPPTASGQVALEDLANVYQASKVTADTPLFGVVGNPVAHSRSPHLHNTWFGEAKIRAIYVPFFVQNLQSEIRALETLGVRGLSVAVPHKQAAGEIAAHADSVTRAVRACNTLLRDGERWRGVNTDGPGVREAILKAIYDGPRPERPFAGKEVVVLGAGGAAAAAAYALRDAKSVVILNRHTDRARDLAIHFNRHVGAGYRTPTFSAAPLESLRHTQAEIVIQATSVGMEGGAPGSPVPPAALPPTTKLVVDMIYAPEETEFVRACRERGLNTQNGMPMLCEQARLQFTEFSRLATAPV